MLDMRLRLSELMEAKGLKTAYALERYSKGVLPITTATRLVKAKDRPKRVDLATLQDLCDVFKLDDMNDLFERDGKPKPKTKRTPDKPAVTKRKNSRAA